MEVTHYGPAALADAEPAWRIEDKAGKVLAEGVLAKQTIPRGTALPLGRIETGFDRFAAPQHVKLYVDVAGHVNDWDLWVFAPAVDTEPAPGIHVVRRFDKEAQGLLAGGAKVLLVPAAATVAGDEAGPVPAGWSPIFWNTLWTGFQPPHTLGLLCDPEHAALAQFPTEYHSNWQWWDLVHGGQIFILDNLPRDVRPIVRVIDDWVTNRRLGLVLEVNVGGGKLLICGSDIVSDLDKRPVARQMRRSLLDYMASGAFAPSAEVTPQAIAGLFNADVVPE